jgi:Tfp pilus assembly protein PilN
MNMQLLYALIMTGLLVLLLVAGMYLARNQKTPTRRSEAWLDPLRSKGIGPVLDATAQLNKELSAAKQQPHGKQTKHK